MQAASHRALDEAEEVCLMLLLGACCVSAISVSGVNLNPVTTPWASADAEFLPNKVDKGVATAKNARAPLGRDQDMESSAVSSHQDWSNKQPGRDEGEQVYDSESISILKERGNALFQEHKFQEAVDIFTKALEMDRDNCVVRSNRALVHIKMENFGLAKNDAEHCIKTDVTFAKGHYRRGTACLALGMIKEAHKSFKMAHDLKPTDKDALNKLKHCEFLIKKMAFEAALRVDERPDPFEVLDLNTFTVPDDYDGVRFDGNITQEFVEDMVERFKAGKLIHKKYAYRILYEVKPLFEILPNVVDLEIKRGNQMTVCGDTHGQFYDLLRIFELNDKPSEKNPYVFNGDFVDRGSWSMEVIMTLLAYKLLYPDHMHLTRGNHETCAMNQMYGFMGEIAHKFGRHMYECFVVLFKHLPLAMTLNKKVFICHGGLFTDDRVTLDDIQKVNRVVEPPSEGILCDILWSDPQEEPGRSISKRGTGCMFGPDVTERWLKENKMRLLVRSHEMKEDGYDVQHNGKCITIFSAPNYCDQMGNKGAFIKFGHDCHPCFTRFDAAWHPNVRPMAYSVLGGM